MVGGAASSGNAKDKKDEGKKDDRAPQSTTQPTETTPAPLADERAQQPGEGQGNNKDKSDKPGNGNSNTSSDIPGNGAGKSDK